MTTEWAKRSVVISRLRLVSPGDDALAMQLRVSRLLAASRLAFGLDLLAASRLGYWQKVFTPSKASGKRFRFRLLDQMPATQVAWG